MFLPFSSLTCMRHFTSISLVGDVQTNNYVFKYRFSSGTAKSQLIDVSINRRVWESASEKGWNSSCSAQIPVPLERATLWACVLPGVWWSVHYPGWRSCAQPSASAGLRCSGSPGTGSLGTLTSEEERERTVWHLFLKCLLCHVVHAAHLQPAHTVASVISVIQATGCCQTSRAAQIQPPGTPVTMTTDALETI